MDRNSNYDPIYDPAGILAIIATVFIALAILAAVGHAAGVPVSEMFSQ